MNKELETIYFSNKLESICLLKTLTDNETLKNIEVNLSRDKETLKFLETLTERQIDVAK